MLMLSCKLGYRLLKPSNATFRCEDEDTWEGGELAILRQKCVKVRRHLDLDFNQVVISRCVCFPRRFCVPLCHFSPTALSPSAPPPSAVWEETVHLFNARNLLSLLKTQVLWNFSISKLLQLRNRTYKVEIACRQTTSATPAMRYFVSTRTRTIPTRGRL